MKWNEVKQSKSKALMNAVRMRPWPFVGCPYHTCRFPNTPFFWSNFVSSFQFPSFKILHKWTPLMSIIVNHIVMVSRELLVGRSVAHYSRSWIGHCLSNRVIVKSRAGRCGGYCCCRCSGCVLKSMLCEYRCRQCRRCDTKVTQLHLRLRGKAVERARAFTSTACEIDDRLA
jgi:hypothetical protein